MSIRPAITSPNDDMTSCISSENAAASSATTAPSPGPSRTASRSPSMARWPTVPSTSKPSVESSSTPTPPRAEDPGLPEHVGQPVVEPRRGQRLRVADEPAADVDRAHGCLLGCLWKRRAHSGRGARNPAIVRVGRPEPWRRTVHRSPPTLRGRARRGRCRRGGCAPGPGARSARRWRRSPRSPRPRARRRACR